MDETTVLEILKEYDSKVGLYSSFTSKMERLIKEILAERRIQVHSVSSRLKEKESLRKKLARPDSKYENLVDITDIAGIRIITYLYDDVDRVAKLIEREFIVDPENSIDRRATLDPDRFGYVSLHHVVSLRPERTKLTEYSRFSSLKAEIQTRSILQHAWAEIEHDLGYKSSIAVPKELRRRFARLAGLLELADAEFVAISNELKDYEDRVPQRIEKEPQLVNLNKASLTAFLNRSALVLSLDKEILGFVHGERLHPRDATWVERDLRKLRFFGIETIAELEAVLKDHKDLIISFAQQFIGQKRHESVRFGISLLYLCYVLAGELGDENRIREFLDSAGIDAPSARPDLSIRLLKIYESITKT